MPVVENSVSLTLCSPEDWQTAVFPRLIFNPHLPGLASSCGWRQAFGKAPFPSQPLCGQPGFQKHRAGSWVLSICTDAGKSSENLPLSCAFKNA